MAFSKLFFFILAAKTILLVAAQSYSEDYGLPKDLYDMINYKVNLFLNPELFTPNGTEFSGSVDIGFSFKHATNYIALHSGHDTIKLNKITFNKLQVPSSSYSVNNETDILTIKLENQVTTDTRYQLVIEYDGAVTTSGLIGFYKSRYVKENGESKYLLTTQLAPTYARRVFPCFDEPQYKAYFNFEVTYPNDLSLLFNTLGVKRLYDKTTGMTTEYFHQTPRMSTYVLALVVSDLTCSFADATIPLRVCSRGELAPGRSLALQMAPKLLETLNNFTNYNYKRHSIGKLDIVAVPDFPAFAMENWGLLIHRETELLYDNVESSNKYKEEVINALAHALAHQWFGNLVTVSWWSEMYLNEALAMYLQYYAVNEVLPDDEVEKRFVVKFMHNLLVQDAVGLELFSLTVGHISTTAEIDYVFNEVSYHKGGCIMRMLQHFMSLDNFRQGIQNYIHKYQFRTADSADFWTELNGTLDDSISKMPANLSTVMKNWTDKAGYPLVSVSLNGSSLTISQANFWYYYGADNDTKWYIPISYADSKHLAKFQSTIPDFWLTPDSDFQIPFPSESEWLLLNNQQIGYYRVNYDAVLWSKIKVALQRENFDGIIDINRAQIIDDLFSFAKTNLMAYSFVLDTIRFLKNDMSYYPWYAALRGLTVILRRVGEFTDLGKAIRKDLLDLIDSFYKSVPMSNIKENDPFYTLKQVLAVKWACQLGHQDCINEAVNLFKMHRYSKKRPPVELRNIIYCNGLKHSNDVNDWTFMWDVYLESENMPSEQKIIRRALACSRNTTILENYLNKTITKDSGIRTQDCVDVFTAVAENPVGVDVAFNFLIENQESIVEYYQTAGALETIFTRVAIRLKSEDQVKKIIDLINNGSLTKEFKEHSFTILYVANVTGRWLDKYSQDLTTYYGNKIVAETSHLYLLFLIMPMCLLIFFVYFVVKKRELISNWFRNLNLNRRRVHESENNIPMLGR